MFSKFSLRCSNFFSKFRFSTSNQPVKIGLEPFKDLEITGKHESSALRIELAQPMDRQNILNFLGKNFFCHEPLCKSLKLCNKTIDRTMNFYVSDLLSQGMTLVAREPSRENEIMGLCVNHKNCEWDGKRLEELSRCAENLNYRKLLLIWSLLSKEPKLHGILGDLSFFQISFIAVEKNIHGHGLAGELVKRSLSLGRDLNYLHARIDSTSDFTRKIAEGFRMEKSWEVVYRNIIMDDEKTPVVVPEHPHCNAAVYHVNLKAMGVGNDGLVTPESQIEYALRAKKILMKLE